MNRIDSRLEFVEIRSSHRPEVLADVVREGLGASPGARQLPCRYFYDTAGSLLFEQICALPEYYLTRTEQAILDASAGQMIDAAGRGVDLVEFGSGSSIKTRLLLTAALERQRSVHYTAIDISRDFLRQSAHELLGDFPRLEVTAVAAEYNDGIAALSKSDAPRLFLFLGSNIGNFVERDAVDFLGRVRLRMRDRDRLLVGIDLVKERELLEAAYNDSQGVTAAFNRNLLARMNAELGSDFDLNAFDHHAPWVEERGRIEMRLVSRCAQRAWIPGLNMQVEFESGEYIHTENSHKYTLAGFERLSMQAGLRVQRAWQDERNWFAVLLLRPEAR